MVGHNQLGKVPKQMLTIVPEEVVGAEIRQHRYPYRVDFVLCHLRPPDEARANARDGTGVCKLGDGRQDAFVVNIAWCDFIVVLRCSDTHSGPSLADGLRLGIALVACEALIANSMDLVFAVVNKEDPVSRLSMADVGRKPDWLASVF